MPQLDAQLSHEDGGVHEGLFALCPVSHVPQAFDRETLVQDMDMCAADEGTFGDWLPQPIADWAQWAYENPSTVAYYGFGAATMGATLVWLVGGRRRR